MSTYLRLLQGLLRRRRPVAHLRHSRDSRVSHVHEGILRLPVTGYLGVRETAKSCWKPHKVYTAHQAHQVEADLVFAVRLNALQDVRPRLSAFENQTGVSLRHNRGFISLLLLLRSMT